MLKCQHCNCWHFNIYERENVIYLLESESMQLRDKFLKRSYGCVHFSALKDFYAYRVFNRAITCSDKQF